VTEVICPLCGKGFEDGEEIIGVSGAIVSDADDAIIADDQPWLALYHRECWKAISMEKSGDTPSAETGDAGQPD